MKTRPLYAVEFPTRDQAAFTRARAAQEKIVAQQPDYGPAVCILGLIDAGLGRKEEALREGRRAMELTPVEKDAFNGAHMIECFAMIAAWVGEKDLACEYLAKAISLPAGSFDSYGALKLLPYSDSFSAFQISASQLLNASSSPPSRRKSPQIEEGWRLTAIRMFVGLAACSQRIIRSVLP